LNVHAGSLVVTCGRLEVSEKNRILPAPAQFSQGSPRTILRPVDRVNPRGGAIDSPLETVQGFP
jgi:hypothetical protein